MAAEALRLGDRAAPPAGHRLVRQRGDRRGHAGPAGRLADRRVRARRGPAPACSTLLESLGATIHPCARRADDPPGDPAVLRFREAVAAGAVPFSVQGPENALCLDGGRTIGWELADAGAALDRVVVQVGGGAFAACTGWGLGAGVRLDAVQTEGCAPLARALAPAAALAADDAGRPLGRADDAVGRPALGGRRHPRRRDLRLARRARRRAALRRPAVVVPEAADRCEAHELGRADGHPGQRHRHRRPRRPAHPRRRARRPASAWPSSSPASPADRIRVSCVGVGGAARPTLG